MIKEALLTLQFLFADPAQHACLAKNIYFEARNQSTAGQIAVSHVVMNRVKALGIQTQYVKLCIKDKLRDGGEKPKARLLCLRIDANSVGTVMDYQMSLRKEPHGEMHL